MAVMPSEIGSVLFEMREELTCRICLGYLEDASATPCHHVFCKKCIEESLRHHGACPTCRTRIKGPRALRDASVTNVVIARYCELLCCAETLDRKHAVQSDSLALCLPAQSLAGNDGSSEVDIQSISEQIHCAVKDGQIATLRNLLKSTSFQPAALECRSTDERSTPLQQAAAHGNRCTILLPLSSPALIIRLVVLSLVFRIENFT